MFRTEHDFENLPAVVEARQHLADCVRLYAERKVDEADDALLKARRSAATLPAEVLNGSPLEDRIRREMATIDFYRRNVAADERRRQQDAEAARKRAEDAALQACEGALTRMGHFADAPPAGVLRAGAVVALRRATADKKFGEAAGWAALLLALPSD